jgi:hypothetical protein
MPGVPPSARQNRRGRRAFPRLRRQHPAAAPVCLRRRVLTSPVPKPRRRACRGDQRVEVGDVPVLAFRQVEQVPPAHLADPSRTSQASGRASVQPFASQPVKARCDIPGVFGASTGSPGEVHLVTQAGCRRVGGGIEALGLHGSS